MLSRLGYVVEAVVRSPDALEMFTSDPSAFDLIITDQTMPALTGQQLAQCIKKVRADIPILLTTGFSSSISPEALKRSGIKQVIHKPFTRKEIGDAIRHALDKV